MTPVLPGYYGSVPDDFPAKHGGVRGWREGGGAGTADGSGRGR
ncbi:hypothetical protein ACIP6X_42690 [Streptomyces coeruleorubidus]